jgi:rSAM/selenodomain-associated transferase 1
MHPDTEPLRSTLRPDDRRLVIVFAKAPIPGKVKTRLIPALGAERAASLHRAFVADFLAGLAGFPVELHTDVEGWFAFPRIRLQTDGDLGERMYHAGSVALSKGYEAVCLLGSDAPTLPSSHIDNLLASEADVTLGPADDGGYWGICFRRTVPGMFAGVKWSTDSAFAQTIESARRAGLSTAAGQGWWDVDNPEDLERLLRCPNLPKHIEQWRASCRQV